VKENYPYGFNPGQIDIVGVWVDGKTVDWNMEGKEETLLSVKLGKPLKQGGSANIKIDFQEKIPHSKTDFGSYSGVSCFENWYPVLCVYDSEGWHKEPGSKIGESNFSEVSDYTVNINLPVDEVVASSGKCIKESKTGNNRKDVILKESNVRDFTWVSSNKFKKVEKKINGITVISYFLDRDKQKGIAAMNFASRAIEFYSETAGKYPYDRLSVVETGLYGGAMEYPLLISIGEQYYKYKDARILEGAVAHETAHQWWYVIVGNNEYREPWLDESFAEYSEAMYFEKYYGRDSIKQKINYRVGVTNFDRVPADSMDKFSSGSEYSLVVYMKGAYILDQLRNKVGDENFYKVLKEYYEEHKFKNASSQDFFDIVQGVCGSEAKEFIKLRLMGVQ
jgi:aminopeptidase N